MYTTPHTSKSTTNQSVNFGALRNMPATNGHIHTYAPAMALHARETRLPVSCPLYVDGIGAATLCVEVLPHGAIAWRFDGKVVTGAWAMRQLNAAAAAAGYHDVTLDELLRCQAAEIARGYNRPR